MLDTKDKTFHIGMKVIGLTARIHNHDKLRPTHCASTGKKFTDKMHERARQKLIAELVELKMSPHYKGAA